MVKDAWLVAILITGASGKLGSQLVKVFPGAICPTSRELDITDKDAVNKWVREHRPEMIIHAAALTGIRECEENKALAWKTNVSGTENLLGSCDDRSSKPYFVYVSTACVFFGEGITNGMFPIRRITMHCPNCWVNPRSETRVFVG